MTSTLVDCRWLGYSGVGRVTEVLLRGMAERRPPGQWVLWGPAAAEAHTWAPDVAHVLTSRSPLALFGQREIASVPRADRYLFPHLVRPLRHGSRSVVIAHDTIPVRFASPSWKRVSQRWFYVASARAAAVVLAYSDATERNLVADLGLTVDQIRRVTLTTDLALPRRVSARRAEGHDGADHLLYVGLHRPQKNLARALDGFARSQWARGGGRFVLAGIQSDAVDEVRQIARAAGAEHVVVLPRQSEDALVELYARAVAVVVPSLEEGYGLPVIEALAAGVPVCCSDRSGTVEAAHGLAEVFNPEDVDSIAAAIDRCVALDAVAEDHDRVARFEQTVRLPTPGELAVQVLAALDEIGRG